MVVIKNRVYGTVDSYIEMARTMILTTRSMNREILTRMFTHVKVCSTRHTTWDIHLP